MLLALVVACACPSFEEMEVRGEGDAEADARVADALADFAAWTGREGVCVPGVNVEAVVRVRGVEVDGAYAGPHGWIAVSAGSSDLDASTWHELCHAIDDQEGHSAAQPDLFVGDGIGNANLYPTARARRREAFALGCQDGASGVELILAVDEACGGSRWGLGYAYTQAHVYTAFPRNPIVPSGVDLRRGSRTLGLGAGVEVTDAVGAGGSLVLLADWPGLVGTSWGLMQVDPTTGASMSSVRLGTSSAEAAGAQLVRSDGPLRLLVGAEDGDRDLLEVDLATGTATVLAEGLDLPRLGARAAWSENTLFVTSNYVDAPRTVAWSDGTLIDLDAPAPGYAIAPVPGGFEAFTEAGFERYIDGAWSLLPTVGTGGPDLVPVGDGWRLATSYAEIGYVWVLVDAETGAYGLPTNPCQTSAEHATSWVRIGDEVLLVGAGVSTEDGLYPIQVLTSG